MRSNYRYGGDRNQVEDLQAQALTADGWRALELGPDSPGFLIFVYSFPVCQHTYFHANCTESGLLLDKADVELLLVAGDDWKIGQVSVGIAAALRAGEARADIVDYIESRMRQCPVSINLQEPPDYCIELDFG